MRPTLLCLVAIIILFFVFTSASVDFAPSGRTRQMAARMQIAALIDALDAYRSDVGDFPTESEGLSALRTNPGVPQWRGPYIVRDVPTDPWGMPYRYSVREGSPLVVSLGGGPAHGERAISSSRGSNGRKAHFRTAYGK
jgi:general secretion pathway protein G